MPLPDSTGPDAVAGMALHWMVVMASGEASEQERRDFSAWLHADPAHRQAWDRMHGGLDRSLSPLRRAAAPGRAADRLCEALAPDPRRRRAMLQVLAVAGLAGGAGWLARDKNPLSRLTADCSTGTAQRRAFRLPDGSELLLNARSAVDVHLDPAQRRLVLRQGELIVRVQPDARLPPLEVVSQEGVVRSRDGRLLVRQEAGCTLVAALSRRAGVQPAKAPAWEAAAGRAVRFDARGRLPGPDLAAQACAAWQNGRLEAHDQPLGQVVQALQAYWPGVLSVSDRAAVLRVFGVYNLDEPRQAVASIGQTLPVRIVSRFGGRWVAIDAA